MAEHHSPLGTAFDPLRIQVELPYAFYTQRIPNMRFVPDQQFEYSFRYSTYGYRRVYVQWE